MYVSLVDELPARGLPDMLLFFMDKIDKMEIGGILEASKSRAERLNQSVIARPVRDPSVRDRSVPCEHSVQASGLLRWG